MVRAQRAHRSVAQPGARGPALVLLDLIRRKGLEAIR
jgi:hypothetical protein